MLIKRLKYFHPDFCRKGRLSITADEGEDAGGGGDSGVPEGAYKAEPAGKQPEGKQPAGKQPEGKQSPAKKPDGKKPDGKEKENEDKTAGDGGEQPSSPLTREDGEGVSDLSQYEYSVPDGQTLPDDVKADLDDYKEVAHTLGITPEQFAGLAESYIEKVGEKIEDFYAAQAAYAKELETAMGKDAEIYGGSEEVFTKNKALAQKVFTAFAGEDLKALVEVASPDNPHGLGLGYHPAFIRFLTRLGQKVSPDTLEVGGASKPDTEQGADLNALYPSMDKAGTES